MYIYCKEIRNNIKGIFLHGTPNFGITKIKDDRFENLYNKLAKLLKLFKNTPPISYLSQTGDKFIIKAVSLYKNYYRNDKYFKNSKNIDKQDVLKDMETNLEYFITLNNWDEEKIEP